MLSGHFTSGEKAKDGKIVRVVVVVGKEAECGWSEWSCGRDFKSNLSGRKISRQHQRITKLQNNS